MPFGGLGQGCPWAKTEKRFIGLSAPIGMHLLGLGDAPSGMSQNQIIKTKKPYSPFLKF
jgi:hypothetical protein